MSLATRTQSTGHSMKFVGYFAAMLVLAAACSTPVGPAGGAATDSSGQDGVVLADGASQTDVTAADSDVLADGQGTDDTAISDTGIEDEGSVEDIAEPDIDWSELLDNDTEDAGPPPEGPVGQLYAHTADTLYRLDLAAGKFTTVGKFAFNKSKGSVTDVAMDAYGKLYSVTDHDLFVCDVASAACKWLAKLPGTSTFNGLTFVPKGTVDADSETLIGIETDGSWDKVDFSGSSAKLTKLGLYGDSWLSSGDAFSVEGIGTYATLKGKGTSDSLALIDPTNGKIIKVIGETGVKQLYGFAWWSGVFYGFSADGKVYTLDVTTAKATPVKGITVPAGAKWWGAGVSTRAAGKQN